MRQQKIFYVYILASKRNGTLYIGVTNDLDRRVREHKEGLVPGFTKKHGVAIALEPSVLATMQMAIINRIWTFWDIGKTPREEG